MGSSQPIGHRPTLIANTNISDGRMPYLASPSPSTPGSAMGSPESCDVLQTGTSCPPSPPFSTFGSMASSPDSRFDQLSMNADPMLSGLDGIERKVSSKDQGQQHVCLPGPDWGCESPAMTPGRLHFSFRWTP